MIFILTSKNIHKLKLIKGVKGQMNNKLIVLIACKIYRLKKL